MKSRIRAAEAGRVPALAEKRFLISKAYLGGAVFRTDRLLRASVYSVVILCCLWAGVSLGSENGRSTYSPGTLGDFSLAVLPDSPGFYLRNETFHYEGNNRHTALGGAVKVDADLDAWVEIPRVTWVSGWEILGARHGAYVSLPLARVEASAQVEQIGAAAQNQEDSRWGISDFYLSPVMLDWKAGSANIMLLETVTIPSGTYDKDEFVNISRNYCALNSSLAATWRHPVGGPELDLRAGYIVNAENSATDYRTGDEFALDATAAWRLDQRWAVGLTGYRYEQVTGDSGEGAVLGDFKSRSAGVGPIARYIVVRGDRRVSLVGKWIHEFDAANRFEGDMLFFAFSTRL